MIEKVTTNNFDEVLPLIKAYQEFYGVTDIDEAKNRNHFGRFIEDNTRGMLFILKHEEKAIGFVTIYFGFSSVRAEEVGILNDLYVLPDYRGEGHGKTLIYHAIETVKNTGINRIQWLTAKNNEIARKTYDSFNANKSEWYVYSMDI